LAREHIVYEAYALEYVPLATKKKPEFGPNVRGLKADSDAEPRIRKGKVGDGALFRVF
jgi:hypothetical protein